MSAERPGDHRASPISWDTTPLADTAKCNGGPHAHRALIRYDARTARRCTDLGVGVDAALTFMALAYDCRLVGVHRQACR